MRLLLNADPAAAGHLLVLSRVLQYGLAGALAEVGAAHAGQPVAVDVGEVVAGAARALALHERLRPEVLQAAARGCQRLATALVSCARVLAHT